MLSVAVCCWLFESFVRACAVLPSSSTLSTFDIDLRSNLHAVRAADNSACTEVAGSGREVQEVGQGKTALGSDFVHLFQWTQCAVM